PIHYPYPRPPAPCRGTLPGRLLPHPDLLSEGPSGEPQAELDHRLEPRRAVPRTGPLADRRGDRPRGGGDTRSRHVRASGVCHATADGRRRLRLDTSGAAADLSSIAG